MIVLLLLSIVILYQKCSLLILHRNKNIQKYDLEWLFVKLPQKQRIMAKWIDFKNVDGWCPKTPLMVSENSGVSVGDFADALDRTEAVLEFLADAVF